MKNKADLEMRFSKSIEDIPGSCIETMQPFNESELKIRNLLVFSDSLELDKIFADTIITVHNQSNKYGKCQNIPLALSTLTLAFIKILNLNKMKNLILIMALAILAIPIFSQDIQSNTSGFSLGINGEYAGWSSSSFFVGELDDLEPNGFGFNVNIAYGFSQQLEAAIFLTQDNFVINEDWNKYKLSEKGIAFRYNFGATLKKVRPYAIVALSFTDILIDPIIYGNDFTNEIRLKMTGLGIKPGAGIQYFISPSLAINVSVNGSFGKMHNITFNGSDFDPEESVDFSTVSVNLGLRYYIQY